MKDFIIKDRPLFITIPLSLVLMLFVITPFLWKAKGREIQYFVDHKTTQTNDYLYLKKYQIKHWEWDKKDRLRMSCQQHSFGYMYAPRDKWWCPICTKSSKIDWFMPGWGFDLLKEVVK